jgi:7 transmembrane receptor (rhodopsin family)
MPFAQSMVILVDSIFLVFIAFDRYLAIKNIKNCYWKPSKLFCIICCLLVWLFAAGVASPMMKVYNYSRIELDKMHDSDHGFMCGKNAVSLATFESSDHNIFHFRTQRLALTFRFFTHLFSRLSS